ncbi:hypothetical protein ACFZB9_22340 [Kitasatospora sp. NPDC008050]|uniref:hypothetical protein n=1 Tax=Kitasatospora sp. NPDC008050 TaxID=3364021 RepID=UPI0036E34DC8
MTRSKSDQAFVQYQIQQRRGGNDMSNGRPKVDVDRLISALSQSKLLNLETSVRDVLQPDLLKAVSEDDNVVFWNNNYCVVVKPVPEPPSPPPPDDGGTHPT